MVRYVIPIVVVCISGCGLFYVEWDRGNSPPKGRAIGGIEGCKWSADGDLWDMELEEVTYKCKWSDEQVNDWLRKQ